MSTTSTIVRNSFSTTYLLPDITRRTSSRSATHHDDGEDSEKTTEPKNKLRSVSDEPTGYSVVEGTQPTISESPPTGRAEHNSPISFPAATARASRSKQSELLLRRFNWAYPRISTSGRRVCKKVLQFIIDHSAECAEFPAVGPGDYTKLEQFIERSGLKPRLTYIQKERTLLVEMPSPIHEVPMAALQCAFIEFFRTLPFPKTLVSSTILTNVTTDSSIPDLRIALQNVTDYRFSMIVTGLGETAFSQSLKSLYTKLRTAVEVNPSLLMAMAAVINEVSQYHAPLANSPAWKALLFEPTIRPRHVFVAGAGVHTPALHQPIIIEGHTWSSIATVRFKVWVRPGDAQVDDHTIDIDTDNPDEVAEGTFYPTNDMGAVLKMMERGADAMREKLIALCQETQPNFDIRPLQDPKLPKFFLDLDEVKTRLLGAMTETAYERYKSWYEKTPRPRGKKRNAADAELGVLDIPNSTLGPASNTRSNTLNRKRPRVVGVARRR